MMQDNSISLTWNGFQVSATVFADNGTSLLQLFQILSDRGFRPLKCASKVAVAVGAFLLNQLQNPPPAQFGQQSGPKFYLQFYGRPFKFYSILTRALISSGSIQREMALNASEGT